MSDIFVWYEDILFSPFEREATSSIFQQYPDDDL
jgi:hypothetical protein